MVLPPHSYLIWLNISNGFVSVTFIFCAGCGFWLAAVRKSEAYLAFKKPLWIYLRRIGFVILMGYWIHIPYLSLQNVLNRSSSELISFFV
jgi:hypothetical protein